MKKLILILLLSVGSVFGQYTTALAPDFYQQYESSAGVVCAGCKLYSFAAGTSTPLATYTDNTLSTPNANPVVLDSAGRARVWLSNVSYKLELRTSAGTSIKIVDNVSDVALLLKRDLAATTSDSLNSAMIGFKPPGGTATTVRAALIALTFSTASYGALCDGSTDDTTALQAAIDAASGLKAALQVQTGTCIATSLTIPNNLTLKGQGMGVSILKQKTNSAVAGTSFLTAANKTGVTIQDLTIDGGSQTLVQTVVSNWETKNHLLKTTDATNLLIDHVAFLNAIYCSWYGDGLANARVTGSRFVGWGADNIGAICVQAENGASNYVEVTGNYIDGDTSNSSGIKMSGSPSSKLSNVLIEGNTVMQGDPTSQSLGIELWSPTTPDTGFENFRIANNNVIGAGTTGNDVFGISVCGAGGRNGTIVGNTVRGTDGISIEICSSHVTVTGNSIYSSGYMDLDGNNGSGHTNVVFDSNVIYDPQDNGVAGNAIYIGTSGVGTGSLAILSNVTVSNNQIYYANTPATAPYAIWIQANSNGLTVLNVNVIGNHITMASTTGTTGVMIQADGTGTTSQVLVAGNWFNGMGDCIEVTGGGTVSNIRVINNSFGATITNRYVTLPTTSGVLETNVDGTVKFRENLVLDREANHIKLSSDDTNPNIVSHNTINFGTEFQGGFESINSQWTGSGNWVKTSSDAYNGAMFLRKGAAIYQVGFGNATNALTADPATVIPFDIRPTGTAFGTAGVTADYRIVSILGGSGTYNPGGILTLGNAQTNLTIAGCAAGDVAFASLSTITTQALLVSATGDTNAVRVTIYNPTAGTITPGSGTLKVTCFKTV